MKTKFDTNLISTKVPGTNKLASCGLAPGFARGFCPRKNPRYISNIPVIFPMDSLAIERREQDRSWQVYLRRVPNCPVEKQYAVLGARNRVSRNRFDWVKPIGTRYKSVVIAHIEELKLSG